MQFFQIHGALTSDLIQEQHIDWLYAAIESQSEKQKRINLVKKKSLWSENVATNSKIIDTLSLDSTFISPFLDSTDAVNKEV